MLYALLKQSGPDTAGSALKKPVKTERSTITRRQSSTTTIEPARETADKTDYSAAALKQSSTSTIEPTREAEDNADRSATTTRKQISTTTIEPARETADKTDRSAAALKQSNTSIIEPTRESEDKAELKDGMREETFSGAGSKPAITVSPSTSSVSTTTASNIPPIEPTTTTAAIARTAARFPYTLQLACYSSEEGAKEKALSYKRSGLSPFIVRNFSRKTDELLWVIYSGYYATEKEAGMDKNRYQLSEALVARTPYAVLIGTFASAEEMSEVMTRLEKLKYSVYTIPDGTSVLSLFAGAFTTRTGAEQLNLQLQADGIKSQVMLR